MPGILSRTLDVPAEAIDMNRHLNNLAYLRWMQDIAVEGSKLLTVQACVSLEARRSRHQHPAAAGPAAAPRV